MVGLKILFFGFLSLVECTRLLLMQDMHKMIYLEDLFTPCSWNLCKTFGFYDQDSPQALIETVIQKAKEEHSKNRFDAILMNGDFPMHDDDIKKFIKNRTKEEVFTDL